MIDANVRLAVDRAVEHYRNDMTKLRLENERLRAARPDDHFVDVTDMIEIGKGGCRELERLRAALQNIRALAAKCQHEGGPDGNFKAIEEFAVYGLEGKNP